MVNFIGKWQGIRIPANEMFKISIGCMHCKCDGTRGSL